MKKHMMHTERFNQLMANGTINGKPWKAKFSLTTSKLGPGKWFIRGELHPGERIKVGKELARLDREECELSVAKAEA